MKIGRRLLSFVLAFTMVFLLIPFNAFAADGSSGVKRDIVLMLDVSSSMRGTPFTTMKEAAAKFCQQLLASAGDNRVALVVWESSYTVYPFESDLSAVEQTIADIRLGGGTNTSEALTEAKNLMDTSAREDAVKNIILLTDGIPEQGNATTQGPYTSSDSFYYRYANGAYNVAQEIMKDYHLYTMGFFHNLSGNSLEFGKRFLEDIQNSGYYEVTDADDLEFTFGEVAEDLTQEQLKQRYINQHTAYYRSGFEQDVQEIRIPVDGGAERQNTNTLLGNIVLDAAQDKVSTNYNIASVITDALNMNFDFVDGAVSNYELILADIVTSSYYQDIYKEAATASLQDDTVQLLKALSNYAAEHADKLAAKANESLETYRQEWQTLTQALDQMEVSEDPDAFAELFGKCSIVVDQYIKAEDQKNFLDTLNGKAGYRGDAINALLGAALDTASEMVTYYACYDAYCTASDTFKDVLVLIMYYAGTAAQTDSNGNPVFIGGWDEVYFKESLSAAAQNFLVNASDEATSAQQIAARFAKAGAENLASSFAETGIDLLLGQIPIVKELNALRKAAGLVAAGTMFLVDCATKIDDRAYAASMIYHLYFLANCAQQAADDYGGRLSRAQGTDDAFLEACRFDEAVRVWRCSALMLCDFGITFEEFCLQDAQKHLRPWTNQAMEDASWYSTAISITSFEKERISNIHCHDVNLSYNPDSNTVDLGPNAQVVTIACPVSVTVTDDTGKQIAFLADGEQTIAAGYEPYFHVLETARGSRDYMKICYIPDDWNVSFTGTDDGTMYVLRASVVDGGIQNAVESPAIQVFEGTRGHLSEDDENPVVIDEPGDAGLLTQVTLQNGRTVTISSPDDVIEIPQSSTFEVRFQSAKSIPTFALTAGNGKSIATDTVSAWNPATKRGTYTLYGLGAPGTVNDTTGIYVNGVKLFSMKVVPRPLTSDTTVDFAMSVGQTYQFWVKPDDPSASYTFNTANGDMLQTAIVKGAYPDEEGRYLCRLTVTGRGDTVGVYCQIDGNTYKLFTVNCQ